MRPKPCGTARQGRQHDHGADDDVDPSQTDRAGVGGPAEAGRSKSSTKAPET